MQVSLHRAIQVLYTFGKAEEHSDDWLDHPSPGGESTDESRASAIWSRRGNPQAGGARRWSSLRRIPVSYGELVRRLTTRPGRLKDGGLRSGTGSRCGRQQRRIRRRLVGGVAARG